MTGASGESDERAPLWQRLLPIVVALIIVVVIFGWVLPQFIDYRAAFRAVGRIDAVEWIVLVIAACFRVVPAGWIFVAAQPGLRTRQGISLFLVSNALANVPPGGLDLVSRFQMARSWGFPASSATAATALSWIAATFGKLVMPVVAVLVLAIHRIGDGQLDAAAALGLVVVLAGAAVLFVVLRSPALAIRVGNVLGSLVKRVAGMFGREVAVDFGAFVHRFREESADVLRTRWQMSAASGLAAQLASFVVLFLCIRFVGLGSTELHWSVALAVFSLVALVSAVPIFNIPGVAEAIYIGALTAAAGAASSDVAAAAVLVFRVLTWLVPIAAGGVAYSRWRAEVRRRTGNEPPEAAHDGSG